MRAISCSVIGSGPNGLAGAIRLAQSGCSVTVYEAEGTYGGGCRSAELTLPGFVHDVCSAVHPLAAGSPFFRSLTLRQHGLTWVYPDICLAHPLDDGSAALLERSIGATAATLGVDSQAYTRLLSSLVPDWNWFCNVLMHPVRIALHPIGASRFGHSALQSALQLVDRHFQGTHARALFAGLAAHSFLSLNQSGGAGFALVLAIMGHAVGWPFPMGGSQRIAEALAAELARLGGRIVLGRRIDSLTEIEDDAVILADVNAANLPALARELLPTAYAGNLKLFTPGPGVFKIDYALDGSVPWAAKDCLRAGTVHLGGSFEEIAASEDSVARGEHPERPFVLVAQQSLFDPTRAPEGKQTLWTYCHVPRGSEFDMSARIDAQIERFAPGFTKRILAMRVSAPAELERHNANYVGGDITGGAYTLRQMFARPAPGLSPWSTGEPRLFLCSASTPPGGGVHGMCGYYAAQAALGTLWR
jgi:phytoene dehydrogenase-like protein